MLPSANQFQKSSWPVWLPWESCKPQIWFNLIFFKLWTYSLKLLPEDLDIRKKKKKKHVPTIKLNRRQYDSNTGFLIDVNMMRTVLTWRTYCDEERPTLLSWTGESRYKRQVHRAYISPPRTAPTMLAAGIHMLCLFWIYHIGYLNLYIIIDVQIAYNIYWPQVECILLQVWPVCYCQI